MKIIKICLIVVVLAFLASCSSVPRKANYVAEFDYPILDPCDPSKITTSVFLEDTVFKQFTAVGTQSKKNDYIYDSCFIKFKPTCSKKEVMIYMPPGSKFRIYNLADVDKPQSREPIMTIECIPCKDYDTIMGAYNCYCECKSNFYPLEIGYSFIARFMNDQEIKDKTYQFFDKNSKLIAENVPSNNLHFSYISYYFPLSSNLKWSLGPKIGIIIGDSINPLPIALNLKYLSNPEPQPMRFSCGSMPWYHCWSFRANLELGILWDSKTNAPLISSDFKYQRLYLSGSVGLQWRNYSFNIGLNYLRMPMGEIECCPGIPDKYKFPVRNSLNPFGNLNMSF